MRHSASEMTIHQKVFKQGCKGLEGDVEQLILYT